MKLTNMKLDKKDMAKEQTACCAPDSDNAPQYPWGLSIRLEEGSIKKLGITDMPAADDEMVIMARVKVTESGSIDTADNGQRRNLSLQITDMMLTQEPDKKGAAEALYGTKEKE